MADWSFLTNHARVLLCIAHDPGARLRDIAASVGITERSAYGIVTDLTAAGYVLKQKDGRRNRYQIQAHMPLPEPTSQEPAIGEVLALLAGVGARQQLTGGNHPGATTTSRTDEAASRGHSARNPPGRTSEVRHILHRRMETRACAAAGEAHLTVSGSAMT